jgi:signal transduction histidine kinase
MKPGVGVQGMRERVRQLGGRFEIRSSKGKGTSVIAELPLPKSTGAGAPQQAVAY